MYFLLPFVRFGGLWSNTSRLAFSIATFSSPLTSVSNLLSPASFAHTELSSPFELGALGVDALEYGLEEFALERSEDGSDIKTVGCDLGNVDVVGVGETLFCVK
jgi:hypothetical protein